MSASLASRGRSITTTVLSAVVALAVAAPAQGLSAREPSTVSFTWDGRCIEIASGFAVPVETVDPLVPPGFAILGGETGMALLNVGIARCPEMVIDGVPAPPAFFGFTAVFIEPYEGTGVQRYILWGASSSKALHGAFRDLGIPSVVDADMRMAIEPAVATLRAQGAVPRTKSGGGYALTMESTPSTPAPVTPEALYWHEGSRGLVRVDFAVAFEDTGTGPAELRAEPGTPMARIVGRERASGGALLAEFAFDGTFTLMR